MLKWLVTNSQSTASCSTYTDVWIVSDGRNYGASRFIGRLLAESKKKSKPSHADSDDDDLLTDRPSDPVLIGVTHWGSLKRKKLLCGISVRCSFVACCCLWTRRPEDRTELNWHIWAPFVRLVHSLSGRQTNDKVGQFRLSIKSANKSLSSVMQKSAEFVCDQNRPILFSK